MEPSPEVVSGWLDTGRRIGASHMLIVLADKKTSWEYYPIYVSPEEDVDAVRAEHDQREMQRVTRIYTLDLASAMAGETA